MACVPLALQHGWDNPGAKSCIKGRSELSVAVVQVNEGAIAAHRAKYVTAVVQYHEVLKHPIVGDVSGGATSAVAPATRAGVSATGDLSTHEASGQALTIDELLAARLKPSKSVSLDDMERAIIEGASRSAGV